MKSALAKRKRFAKIVLTNKKNPVKIKNAPEKT